MRMAWRRIGLVIALPAMLALVAGCGGSGETGQAAQQGGDGGRPETLRFAVSDLEGLQELQRNFGPFSDRLSEMMGVEIEFYAVPNLSAAAAAMEADRVDVVLGGPSEYVLTRTRVDVVPVVGIDRPNYRTVIATRPGTGIESVQDLRGKEVATFAAGGTTTELGTCKILQDAGMDCRKDVELTILGDYDPLARAFLQGDIPAAGLPYDSRYKAQLLEDNGLSEEDAPIVAEGRDMPPDVLMASPKLSEEFVREMRDKILRNEDQLLQAIIGAGGEYADTYGDRAEFVAVEDSDYDYVREAYGAAGYDSLQQILEES
jgi:phosphonate transport system substrate-binding protein